MDGRPYALPTNATQTHSLMTKNRAPLTDSRKWGLYYIANLLFKTYFKVILLSIPIPIPLGPLPMRCPLVSKAESPSVSYNADPVPPPPSSSIPCPSPKTPCALSRSR